MLSAQENEALTKVGPGTPMGELMRRYWHPVAAAAELDERPTKAVPAPRRGPRPLPRPLRDLRPARPSLCPPARRSLPTASPRSTASAACTTAGCTTRPANASSSPSKRPSVRMGGSKRRCASTATPSSPVGALVGIHGAPARAPHPRVGALHHENGYIDIGIVELPCNWLQCQENSHDPRAPRVAPRLLGRPTTARAGQARRRRARRQPDRPASASAHRLHRIRARHHQAPRRRGHERRRQRLEGRTPCAVPPTSSTSATW